MKSKHLVMSLLWVVVMILAIDNWCHGCLEEERFALLQLKASINYPNHTYLPSWEEEDDHSDCCHWERVDCNSTTRRVIELSLNDTRDYHRDDYWYLNVSILLPFESLRSLDLSGNQLSGFVEDEGLGILSNLRNLEDLNLGYSALDNSILPDLNKLSNLKILNLTDNELNGTIDVKEFDGLSNLKELDLSFNRIITINGSHEKSGMNNLEVLDLSGNLLNGTIGSFLRELSSLKTLDLSGNYLYQGAFDNSGGPTRFKDMVYPNHTHLPSWEEDDDYSDCCQWEGVKCNSTTHRVIKFSLSGIKYLDLDNYWHLNASILLPFESLRSLDLSLNILWGFVENEGLGTLYNLRNLEYLDLRVNYLDNSILLYVNKLSNLKILGLAYNDLNGTIDVKEFDGLSNLKELDLSRNYIITIKGSHEKSRMKNLEFLDLSYNELNGTIGSFLRELSSLKTLDLSYNYRYQGAFDNSDLKYLTSLENLYMDSTMPDNDFLSNIGVLTSLRVLSLTNCTLNGSLPTKGLCELKTIRELDIKGIGLGGTLPSCLMNLRSLRLLDISSNQFRGNVARSPLVNLTSLEYLRISNNKFEIPISFDSFLNHSKLKFIESLNNKLLEEEDILARSPSFQLIGFRLSGPEHGKIIRSFPYFLYHQHDLVVVELSGFHTSGEFPNWLLVNNTRMETLLLPYNSFCGQLSLPSRTMKNLLALDISNNHLEGIIPYETSMFFPSIQYLNMSRNDFEGNIPSLFGDMTDLRALDLSNNRLSGEIPVNLAKYCWLLEHLILSNNKLEGPILPHQNNLTGLYTLHLDGNGFTEIPHSLSRSDSLLKLNINQNQLVGKIPRWVGNMSQLRILDMANNYLEGPIPMEFCGLNDIGSLDLSGNNIIGAIPSCLNMRSLGIIKLSKNRLHGPFPAAFRNCTSLIMLDLSDNQFTGKIPNWIGHLSEVSILLLKNNRFEGIIPDQLCHISKLSIIDLSFNNLVGSIPRCMNTIKFEEEPGKQYYMLVFIQDFGNPLFTSLLHDLGMVLEENIQLFEIRNYISTGQVEFKTKGMLLYYEGVVLDLFSGINLSYNNLSGHIPLEIGNLSHIKTLNVSHNDLIGTIPATFSNMKNIESMDLSYNYLDGKIPSQIIELISLEVFNVSFNNLSGSTPLRVAQFATFESSSYVGNPLLCGEPLPKCNSNDSRPSTARVINGSEEDSNFLDMDMDVLYMSFAGSYVTVVMAIVAVLYINPHWRRVWFHLIEVFITSCHYFVVDNLVWPRRGFLSR